MTSHDDDTDQDPRQSGTPNRQRAGVPRGPAGGPTLTQLRMGRKGSSIVAWAGAGAKTKRMQQTLFLFGDLPGRGGEAARAYRHDALAHDAAPLSLCVGE